MTEDNPFRPPSASIGIPGPVRARSQLGIHGTDGMTDEELRRELEAGGRFVLFDYCVSFFVMTIRRSTKGAYFIRSGELAAVKGMRWTLLSLVAGWWGVPWGFIFTPAAILQNLLGGRDVTSQVVFMVLRWDEQDAVERFIGEGLAPPDAPVVASASRGAGPGEAVPDALKQIRL